MPSENDPEESRRQFTDRGVAEGPAQTMFLGQSSLLGPHPHLDFAEVK